MSKFLSWGRSKREGENGNNQNHHHSVVENMVAGFGAGFIATALGFPLDLIKTRMQTSNQTSQKEGSTIFQTGRGIVRNEGVRGLYKGLASPLMTLSVQACISFSSFAAFKKLFQAEKGWHVGNFLAGLSCGPIIGVISTVELHIRTQMQLDNIEKQRFRNSFHCAKKILQKRGVTGLFSGWTVTTARNCAYYSSYFFVYEGAKETLQARDNQTISKSAIPIAGGSAGVAAWFLSYPLDSARAGIQTQTLKKGANPTALQVLSNLVKSQGFVQGIFSGITPTLARASLVHSVRFSAYEGILLLFRRFGSGKTDMSESSKNSNRSFFGLFKKRD